MLPKHLTVAGQKVKIISKELDGDHGQYNHDQRTIYLDPSSKEQFATLLHELVHAALTISGVAEVLGDEKEEAVCRAMELLAPILALRSKKCLTK
jgi:hypothetical protein